MTTFTKTLVLVITAIALSLAACKSTVEGETKRWKRNTTRIGELAAQYPGFKGALDSRKASAEKIYKSAESMSGEAQIEKMSEANRALMKGFVGGLDGMEAKLKELREKRVEAASAAGDDSSRLGAKVAATDAEKAMGRADATLKKGAKDEAAANAVLKKVNGDLDTALAAVEKVLEVDKGKKDAAAKKVADADQAAAAEKADAEAKVAPWTCSYCDTQNPHDAHTCSSCGASRDPKAAEGGKAAPKKP